MRTWAKAATNKLLNRLGLRVVSARWGPRGPWDALERARRHGIIPRQIVDIGASNGTWTRDCLRIYPDSRYFLVDPLSENVPHLKALESAQPNVRSWSGALGSAPATLELNTNGDQASFFKSESFPTLNITRVEVRCLDTFLGTELLQPPDFIKADVQGYELEVLKGASRCLTTTQLLLLEVSYRKMYEGLPLAHEVISAVGEWGFRIYDICTYAGRPSDGELVQSDILFAPASSPLFANERYS